LLEKLRHYQSFTYLVETAGKGALKSSEEALDN
jgi:hypothetical protein